MELLYIGPGIGLGTAILIFVIAGIVLFAFGYIIWYKVRNLFKKKK
jgi:hypothetical protein